MKNMFWWKVSINRPNNEKSVKKKKSLAWLGMLGRGDPKYGKIFLRISGRIRHWKLSITEYFSLFMPSLRQTVHDT